MVLYNNKIISIIAKNRLTVTKAIPQACCYRTYPLTGPSLCLHRGPDGWLKPSTAIGPSRPGHTSSRTVCARAGSQAHCRADPFGHVYSTSTCFTVY